MSDDRNEDAHDGTRDGPRLLTVANFEMLRRYWWVAATICGVASLIATTATLLANHQSANANLIAEAVAAHDAVVRLSARVDALGDASRDNLVHRATAEEHFARIEGVLRALTGQQDAARDAASAIRESLAVERERLGFLYDRATNRPVQVKR